MAANFGWFGESAASSENLYIGGPESSGEPESHEFPIGDMAQGNVGSVIDEELKRTESVSAQNSGAAFTESVRAKSPSKDDKPLIDPEKLERRKDPGEPKAGPPTKDEWLDFFSRVILKVGMEMYADFAFRGVDETLVTAEDLKRITVKREERDVIARPFAEYANKNPLARKHGREIVALTDSIESIITLGIWMRRVNRVAAKYKPKQPIQGQTIKLRPQSQQEGPNGNYGPNPGDGIHGENNGHVPSGFTIINPGGG